MTVSAEPTTLRKAIVSWRNSFMGVTSVYQQADSVYGSMQNLCIESQMSPAELPPVLQALYDEAKRRGQNGRTGTFETAQLIRTADSALSEM